MQLKHSGLSLSAIILMPLAGSLEPMALISMDSVTLGSAGEATSNSILASATSCSLPLPPAIFCASVIWERTA